MATVTLDAEHLRAFLDKRIPELEAYRQEEAAVMRETAIASRRGERHFLFGKTKSDEWLWHEALSRGVFRLPDSSALNTAIYLHKAAWVASRTNPAACAITVTHEEAATLRRIGYGK